MSFATSSDFGSFSDSSLLMPIPGLYADLETGCASVAMVDEFLDAPPSTRIAIVQQWTRALTSIRDSAIVEMFRAFSTPLRELTIVEQVERFRQHCSNEGFNCPSDFAVLLQRF